MLQRALPLAAAVLAGLLGLLDFTERIELQTYDLRVQATARPSAPSNDIVLIAIDNESLRRMEPQRPRAPGLCFFAAGRRTRDPPRPGRHADARGLRRRRP